PYSNNYLFRHISILPYSLRKPRANARGLFILVETFNSEISIVVEDAGGTSEIFWNHFFLADLAAEPRWVMRISPIQPIELLHDLEWNLFHCPALTTDIAHALVLGLSVVILPSRTEGFQELALCSEHMYPFDIVEDSLKYIEDHLDSDLSVESIA